MERIKSIDAFRVIAIFFIIAIHTRPFYIQGSIAQNFLFIFVNQFARFAVPFFFIISGYFFGIKVQYNQDSVVYTSIKVLKRVFYIFIFWSFIYLLPFNLDLIFDYGIIWSIKTVFWNITNIINKPIEFLIHGSKVHLWFLISLANSIIITALFLKINNKESLYYLFIFSLLLYIFGVCAKSYSSTNIGIPVPFNTRNGPFFGTIFFVTGYIISKIKFSNRHTVYGLILISFGYIFHFTETYFLYIKYNIPIYSHDYVFSTYFIGLGFSLLALANRNLMHANLISKYGKYTLGVYAMHFIFIYLLKYFDSRFSNFIWDVLYIILVYFFSLYCTVIISRYSKLRPFFT